MRASLENPSYEEYWPDIDGLALREIVTDEAMPSQTFFDIAVIHLLTTTACESSIQKGALKLGGLGQT